MRNCDKYFTEIYCIVKQCCKNSRKYLTTKIEEEEMAVKNLYINIRFYHLITSTSCF